MNTPKPFQNQTKLPPDYHMHTTLCKHATGSPADYKASALKLGIPELCFTDHCPEPSGYDAKHRMTVEEVPVYHKLMDSLRESSPPDCLRGLVGTHLFDVIGHFDLPKKFGHRLRDKDMTELVQPVLDVIAKSKMGIEINTSGWRRDVHEAYPSPLILSLACEREIPLSFGSDAHAPNEVGYEFAQAVSLARETGFRDSLWFRNRTGTRVALPPK